MLLYGEILNDGISKDIGKLFREKCNCLQACSTILYEADIDRAKLNFAEAQIARHTSDLRMNG